MSNLCKIDARKSYAKMMEKERTLSQNGSQNPLKIEENEVRKSIPKRDHFWNHFWVFSEPVLRRPKWPNTKKTNIRAENQPAENLPTENLR